MYGNRAGRGLWRNSKQQSYDNVPLLRGGPISEVMEDGGCEHCAIPGVGDPSVRQTFECCFDLSGGSECDWGCEFVTLQSKRDRVDVDRAQGDAFCNVFWGGVSGELQMWRACVLDLGTRSWCKTCRRTELQSLGLTSEEDHNDELRYSTDQSPSLARSLPTIACVQSY